MRGQDCGANVPVIDVDLTADAGGTFFTPSVTRVGNCCGTTNPDRCIAFNITLSDDAQGIVFDICAGAVPPGALFYQVACGPPVAVGNILCLDGPGPHSLTFCKPGNNNNVYCITSVPAPTAGPDTLASEGCTAQIIADGFEPGMTTWSSVGPGPDGSLDYLIDCPTCLATGVSAPNPIIPFGDFEICGLNVGGCSPVQVCDTVRVYFASTLDVTIAPEEPAICFGSAGTTVQATGSGGYPPYIYNWSNGVSGPVTGITSPGTYSVAVSDSSGCPPAVYTFEVIQYAMPLVVDAGANLLVCNFEDPIQLGGSFEGIDSASWVGGDGVFTPDRNDPLATYQPTPDEILAGSVTLGLVLNPLGDCPGMSDVVTFTLEPYDTEVTALVQDVSCFGGSDGAISLAFSGNQGPYSVTWAEVSDTGPVIGNLPEGTYTATVTNALGCFEVLTYTVTEPLLLTAVVMDMSAPLCHDSDDGTAEVAIEGGTEPYTILWSAGPGQTGTSATGLASGTQAVEVTDAKGCLATQDFTLEPPAPVQILTSQGIPICPNEPHTLTANAVGGAGGYAYYWSNGEVTGGSLVVSPLWDENYGVYATDANGCASDAINIFVEVITIDEGNLTVSPGAFICPGAGFTLEANYNGNFHPYTYAWSPDNLIGAGPHTVYPADATDYEVTVTDACGNAALGLVSVGILDSLEVGIAPDDPAICFGAPGTTVTAFGTGGTAPYTFTWSNGTTGETTFISNGGIYTVTLGDAAGCAPAVHTFEVEVYDLPLEVDAGADQLICDTSLPVNLTGTFSGIDSCVWVGGEGVFTPDRYDPNAVYQPSAGEILAGGIALELVLLPSGGCPMVSDSVVITIAPFEGDVSGALQNVLCAGAADGEISVTVTGDDGPYSYAWSGNAGNLSTALGLGPGMYTLTVFNAGGCSESFTYEISEPDPLVTTLVETSPPSCFEGEDGSAEIFVTGGTAPYDISWSSVPGVGEPVVGTLGAGNHEVVVTDNHACESGLGFELAEPEAVVLTGDTAYLICQNAAVDLGVMASGGVGEYSYFWSGGLSNTPVQTITAEEDVSFSVFAEDANGCPSDALDIGVAVISMDADALSISADTAVCPGESAFLAAHYDGLYPPYVYSWDGVVPGGPGPHAVSPDSATTYTVTVSDVCNNAVTGAVTIGIYDLPEIGFDEPLLAGCSPLRISLEDTQHTGAAYTHIWTVNGVATHTGNPAVFFAETPGISVVQLTIITSDGCTATSGDSILVEAYPTPDAQFTASSTSAYIDDATIDFTNTSTGDYIFQEWEIENELFPDAGSVSYTFPDTGVYAVKLVIANEYGCADSIQHGIRIRPVYNIVIPNAFTPGNQGGNGFYDPASTSNTIFYPFADYVSGFEMSIFNRWGELIFESNAFSYGWDGTYRGELCPQDVYVYKIEFLFSDGVEEVRVGDVTLFR